MRTEKEIEEAKQTKEKPHAQAIRCRPFADVHSKNKFTAAQKQAQKPGKNHKLPKPIKQTLGKTAHKIATQATTQGLLKANFPKFRKKSTQIKKHQKCPKTEKCPKKNWVKKNCRRRTFS